MSVYLQPIIVCFKLNQSVIKKIYICMYSRSVYNSVSWDPPQFILWFLFSVSSAFTAFSYFLKTFFVHEMFGLLPMFVILNVGFRASTTTEYSSTCHPMFLCFPFGLDCLTSVSHRVFKGAVQHFWTLCFVAGRWSVPVLMLSSANVGLFLNEF